VEGVRRTKGETDEKAYDLHEGRRGMALATRWWFRQAPVRKREGERVRCGQGLVRMRDDEEDR